VIVFRLIAFLLAVAAVFVAFGWFTEASVAHAVGLIAGALALFLAEALVAVAPRP
jgi:hypothetical protein